MVSFISKARETMLAAAVGAAVAGFATAQQPSGVRAEEIEEVRATVTDVDKEQRLVTMRRPDGREITVEAGEEVRNFDQIHVGDTVVARFFEGLAAEVTAAPPGATPALVATDRAAVGARPGAALAVVYTAVVEIESVDAAKSLVKFTDVEGRRRELAVQRPEMQEFVATLKPGDRVMVTYGSGLAIDLEPAN